jgi:hypothetical protein
MTPKKLLAALAPERPMNQDEMGGCVFCGGTPPGKQYGYAGRDLADHERGCAWVKARRLLGDKLADSSKPPNVKWTNPTQPVCSA